MKLKPKKQTSKRTRIETPGIAKLRSWFRVMVNFQLNPRWVTNPVAHRKARPKILGAETPHEKRINDEICRRFTAKAEAGTK